MSTNLRLTFLPYFRVGFTNDMTLNLSVKGNDGNERPITERVIPIRGPDYVLGILDNMVAKCYPPKNGKDVDFTCFPFVEFVDPDFPWRYSPKEWFNAPPNTQGKIPWITLVVLSTEEIIGLKFNGAGGREILSVKASNLPDLQEAWATAHIQMVGDLDISGNLKDPVLIDEMLRKAASTFCSRLFCFRKLKPETRYHAFIVPSSCMGLVPFDLPSPNADLFAWDNTKEDIIQLPIFLHWEFTTAAGRVDFKTLVMRIKPEIINDPTVIGTAAVDATLEARTGEPRLEDPHIHREGALATLDFCQSVGRTFANHRDEGNLGPLINNIQEHLKESLDVTIQSASLNDDEDPLVTYPAYGQYFQHATKNALDPKIWFGELNLDPRNRIAASFGTTVVQNNQDTYAENCWDQVGKIRKANDKRRLTKAGFGISKKIYQKHIDPQAGKTTLDHFMFLTTPFHSHFPVIHNEVDVVKKKVYSKNGSINIALKKTGLIPGMFSGAYSRIAYSCIKRNFKLRQSRSFDLKEVYKPEAIWKPWHDAAENAIFVNKSKAWRLQGRIFEKASGKGVSNAIIKVFAFPKEIEGQKTILELISDSGSIKTNINGEFSVTIDCSGQDYAQLSVACFLQKELKVKEKGMAFSAKGGPLIHLLFLKNGLLRGTNWNVLMDEIRHDQNLVMIATSKGNWKVIWEGSKIRDDPTGQKSEGVGRGANSRWSLTIGTGNSEKRLETKLSKGTLEDLNGFIGRLQDTLNQGSKSEEKGNIKLKSSEYFAIPISKPEIIPASPIDLQKSVLPHFTAEKLKLILLDKLRQEIIIAPPKRVAQGYDPIAISPIIEDPACIALKKLSLDYILPGVGNVPNNKLFLLQENRRFIEAFMAGLNHEMNRELMWREFPTDQRGTIFSAFWESTQTDNKGDISPIHTWTNKLGDNSLTPQSVGGNLVLVIKGDVIQHFPGINIYGFHCPKITNLSNFDEPQTIDKPIFRTEIEPDILIVGFNMDQKDLCPPILHEREIYYFVLQQPYSLPEFEWDDNVPSYPNNYTKIGEKSGDPGWENSAAIARDRFRMPFRLIISAEKLLPK